MKGAVLCLISALILFFNISFVLAGEIELNYDDEVLRGEEFIIELGISNFSGGIYDVKIDLLANGERIARILKNGRWSSTYYYIPDIIENNQTKEFTLIVENYVGVVEIEVRIRDDSEAYESFTGYNIEIIENEEDPEEPPEDEISEEPEENSEEEIDEEEDNLDILNRIINTPNSNISRQFETIYLNSPSSENSQNSEKSPKPKTIKTQNEGEGVSNEQYAYYGLAGFCLVLAFLYIIKNKSNKNEFG